MLERPQIITPQDHPESCALFIKAQTVGEFLRSANIRLLCNDHRILFWELPESLKNNGILDSLEAAQDLCTIEKSTIARNFEALQNMHVDFLNLTTGPKNTLENGITLNLTQSLNGQGTYFYHLEQNHASFQSLMCALTNGEDLYENSPQIRYFKNDIKGPFMLASTHAVGLILPVEFGDNATLHGVPARTSAGETRQTLIPRIALNTLDAPHAG